MSSNQDLRIVGIGASAGGLGALTLFVSALPNDCNACYVVAQHLAPHAKSMMVELISRHATIPVKVAVDGGELKANHLFIAPPNHDVEIDGSKIILTKAGDETRPKPSVDRLFTSIARVSGERAVGVVLSGTGSDGAEGTRAIKSAGGLTIAQEEATAKYSGMPNSALETGQVDLILNPTQIAERLCEFFATGKSKPDEEPDDSADAGLKSVLELIRKEIGNDFSQYKIPTIQRRLRKRMLSQGIESFDTYHQILKEKPSELLALAQEFLVSVTSFFRDDEAFAATTRILRSVIEKKSNGEELRIWSAGCATGEEAYSLAIIVSDLLEELGKNLSVKIFATDLDTDAISKARIGVYSDREVETLRPETKEKHFEQRGDHYELRKRLREGVVFARQDLVQSPPFVKLDFICCRNVIIYFEPKLQTKVFEIFHYALKANGILFLGKSETITGATELFEAVDKKSKLFVKKEHLTRKMPSVVRSTPPPLDFSHFRKKVPTALSTSQLAQKQMLERYGIAGAVVDAEGTIQTIVGNVSPYLQIPSGLESFKLQSLLPKGAAVEFQLLLRKSSKTNSLHRSRAFRSTDDSNKADLFQIQVSPLESREEASSLSPVLLLVTFEKIKKSQTVTPGPTPADNSLALRAAELEQELAATREHLQTVIEELGVTNEELQSTNEELSSTNEELQSSNEELETTNEEFQSTNEELTTLNEEMIVKSGELRIAIADLENIQVSVGLPLLVVDNELRLQRFNPSATELFDVTVADLSRNVGNVSCRCEIDAFSERIREVIATGRSLEATVEAYRAVYQMRITPRHDDAKKVVGAVILFFNNTELFQAEQRLRKSESRIRGIINGTSALISIKDLSGRYLSANRAFLNYFKIEDVDLLGKTDREIFDTSLANQFRNGDLEAVLKRGIIEKKEEVKRGERTSTFLMSRFPLTDDDSTSAYAIGTVSIDITEQVFTQLALEKSENLYRGVVEEQSVFVLRFDSEGRITFVNSSFVRYFGGSAEDYLGKRFSTIVDVADRSYVHDEMARLSVNKQLAQIEHRYSRFGGQARWIRWISKAVIGESNNVQEVQAVGFDVSEYREQTDQMVQREMLFSNIFTYTTDFLTVYRVTSQNELLLESFNRSVEDGSGYAYSQFLGRNLKDLVSSVHSDDVLEKYRICVERKQPQSFDEELILQGSMRYLTTTVIPVVNNAGRVERVVALSRDVSKYKLVQAELLAAKAAAEIANESKSDFLASMSHELRSPLNVVIGMSELLEDASLEESARDQVRSIQRSGKILLTLIEDILDISKIEAGKTKLEFSTFSISELVEEATENFVRQATEKKIKVISRLPKEDLEDFVGDSNRIRQILVNLIGNAVKFTDKGKVETTVTSVGHKTTGRRLVRFEIRDTGIGIPEEQHSRIFKKFSQVDSGLGRRYGGTGLGLVICQRLVTMMNGKMGFSSQWGKGSVFWFELPLSVAQKTAKKTSIPETTTGAGLEASARILAVDDSADSRMLIQMLLRRLGHQFTIVDSGEAAIERIQSEDFDVVLMDVQMPGLDGYETTGQIRKLAHRCHQVPIIAFTANAMVGDSEKCFDAGMNDYVTKPINVDVLKRTISKWANRVPKSMLAIPDVAEASGEEKF